MTPTELTLRALREDGYLVQVVEHWVPGANIRRDLWGFVDVLGLRGEETLAVQCTSYSNVPARVRKITDSEHLPRVREARWRIEVHGWAKEKNRWVLKRRVDLS
jgi:hypothetical protein